ncbi:MAG TPA: Na+/H+ antiporter NhaA [Pseudonocardiaceae bacterium]|nr:Na+/H+ antiporter NhaA [Pseudonocardiaceae bacterium]
MAEISPADATLRGRTLWTHTVAAPLRAFLRTESGSAGVLVGAIVVALVWANVDSVSYEAVWHTGLSIRLGDFGVTRDLRTWINSGLMTLFFLVVGLEARREFDLGDLRDRSRFIVPFAAGLVGLVLPALIYLAFNVGGPGVHGWGVAMSTDTALALGVLTVLGRHVPDRVRIFLLTVFVVDDVVALVVIAVAYSQQIKVVPLGIGIAAFLVSLGAQAVRMRQGLVYVVLGVVTWLALLASGVDPVVAGLALGLATSAYTPARGDLERATGLFRLFREQPTPELARSATAGLTATLSPNARLQNLYHPWTSYVIVPLFGLANAGIVINGGFLAHAYTTPITLGIMVGYVVGKPVAVVGMAWLLDRLSNGRLRPPVGWAAVIGSGTIAGIGFTVSLLIATLAFRGQQLAEAKLGVLSAAVVASLLTWAVYRITGTMSPARKALALLGVAEQLVDLSDEVDEERDHIRGPAHASVTVVEYGDFECPYCGRAEPVVRDLLTDTDLRYVWRHLPLTDVHPHAQLAAEAAEAAAAQGQFWAMHDLLLARQEHLKVNDLLAYAEELGLDPDRFHDDVKRHANAARIAQDVESADLSGVSGTPTFFINGQRHYGAFDIQTLTAAVKIARARARIAS